MNNIKYSLVKTINGSAQPAEVVPLEVILLNYLHKSVATSQTATTISGVLSEGSCCISWVATQVPGTITVAPAVVNDCDIL